MQHGTLRPAAPALVALILSCLLVGFAPAAARAHALALSPDGHRLYVGAPQGNAAAPQGGIDLINADNATLLTRLPVQGVSPHSALALSPDGRYLYAAGGLLAPPLLVIDPATGKLVATAWVGPAVGSRDTLITDLAVSPDGRRLYVLAEQPDSFSVVDTASDKVIATFPLYGVGEALTPDGKKLYIADGSAGSGKNGVVTVFDTATNQVIGEVSVQPEPTGVVASPTATRVYVIHGNPSGSMVDIIDTSSDRVVNANFPIPGGPASAAAVSPDGGRLYLLPSLWNVVAGFDLDARQVIGSVGVGVVPYDLAVSPRGGLVYVLNQRQPDSPDASISVVDTYGAAFQVIGTIDLARAAAAGH